MYQIDGIPFGLTVLVLDFLAWRFLRFTSGAAKFTLRTALFFVLTGVLWYSKLSPFQVAPSTGGSVRHAISQVLELLWWLQAAQVSAAFLGRVVLPSNLHGERLLQDLLRALTFAAAGIAAIVLVLQLPVGGLLATSGAVAVVLGLAVQSTLSDVFSGLILNATQPFQLGDTVSIGDIEGEVIQSDWRATTLLNVQGNTVVVPNSLAAKASIVNHSRPLTIHGVAVTVHISPAVRPEVVLTALGYAISSTVGLLESPRPVVNAKNTSRKHIEYEVLVYVNSSSKKTQTQNILIDHAYRHLSAAGVEAGRIRVNHATHINERLVRGVELFSPLTDDQITQLANSLVRVQFAEGEVIYQVGPECPDDRRSLYIVANGVAALSSPKDGQELELRRLAPGDAVGRVGFLTGMSANIKVVAVTPVVVMRLDKDSISPILQEYPQVAENMLNSLSQYQSEAANLIDGLTVHPQERAGLLMRLLGGMQRLHGLVAT